MDTVSMLNKMRFYCQPILPLVYDESMSYYETLCKVVGQLNTTGDAVNKLNEGLTGEIADRHAADAELDERLKLIESTNAKTHFLVFDGANPNGGFPTRHELYQWVEAGDAIFTLFRTYEEGRGQIDAVSCSYNAGNWGSEASNDFSIIVPIETSYDATHDYAVKQKVAKLTIPPIPQTNLNAPWGLQIIEVNTPYTSAEGVVNLVAVINDSDSVNCSITPSEFLGLYNTTRGGKNLCVAVNAKLSYDGLARSSSVATVDTTNRKIRIAFERDYGTFTENGVKQLNKTLDYIIGDASTNVWTHETIDSKTLDLSRYEGFQFTRGENNVITANDESTPNAVWAQYQSDHSGKIYQNLPVRLIDTVDNAEYWNGVFGIKDDNHMTFTFVTSNYTTAPGKMLVRVIELSADVNTTTWKYAEKEFTLPISGGSAPTYVDFWGTGQSEVYDNDLKAWTASLGTAQTFDSIFDLFSSGDNVVARLYTDSTKSELVAKSIETNISGDKTLGNINFLFVHAATDVVFGFPTIADSIWVTKADNATSAYAIYKWCAIPVPAGDSADNGKVPIINGTKWGLKTLPTAAPVDTAMSDTSTNAVQNKVIKKYVDNNAAGAGAVRYDAKQTLTYEQQRQARRNIDAAPQNTPNFTGYITITPPNGDMGHGVGMTASVAGGGHQYALNISDVDEGEPTLLTGVKTPTDTDTNAAATVEYVMNKVAGGGGGSADAVLYTAQTLTEAQKKQARENIEAASDFVVNGTFKSESDGEVTLDKTFAQIQAAIQEGKHPAVKLSDSGDAVLAAFMPMVVFNPSYVVFATVEEITNREITYVSLTITADDAIFDVSSSPVLNSDGALIQFPMVADPIFPMEIATKKYVDDHLGGAPITIKLGTGNAATSTATFAEIKEALEAGKAPILDSAPGTSHWFALNWTLSGTDRLTIQYGTFNVDGGGKANFTITDVGVSSTGITYVGRQFTTE